MDITDVEWEIVYFCEEFVLGFKCNHKYVYAYQNLDVYFFVTLVVVCMDEEYNIRQMHL